jgi:predicted nucleic acid-binding protein
VTVAKVVDASAIAALLFGEPETDQIAARIRDSHLSAPALIEAELASVCWKKCRRDPQQAALYVAAHALRGQLKIEHRDVDHDAVLQLALRTGLTVYDASYLLLAQIEGVELITLDIRLAAAWRRH